MLANDFTALGLDKPHAKRAGEGHALGSPLQYRDACAFEDFTEFTYLSHSFRKRLREAGAEVVRAQRKGCEQRPFCGSRAATDTMYRKE